MVNNSFTLDSQNIDVVIPNRRIKNPKFKKSGKTLDKASKKVPDIFKKAKPPRTKFEIPRNDLKFESPNLNVKVPESNLDMGFRTTVIRDGVEVIRRSRRRG